MTTYTRNTLSGSLAPVNNELEKIEVSLREKLDRNPSVGQNNELLSNLDANTKRIINLAEPIDPNDAVRLQDLEVAGGALDFAGKIEGKLDYVDTTANLIGSSNTFTVGKVITTLGYYIEGDGGGAQWIKTATTGEVLQSPALLGDALLNDANGNQWGLVIDEAINIKSLGGSYSLTDNLSVINAAVASFTNTGEILFPDDGDSIYTVSSKPNSKEGVVFEFIGSAKFNSNALYPDGTVILRYNQQGTETSYLNIRAIGDNIQQEQISGSKVNALKVSQQMQGGHTGGRHAIYGVLSFDGSSDVSGIDRNYVAIQGQTIVNSSDGGTDVTPATAKGAFFGLSSIVNVSENTTNLLNVTGAEINTKIDAGSSCWLKSGVQVVDKSAEQGVIDAGLLVAASASSVGWKVGLLLSDSNGGAPLSANGSIIATSGEWDVGTGIDFTTVTFSGNIFQSKPFTIFKNGSLEVGQTSNSEVKTIDFHTSGNNLDYDSRIQASGGGVSSGLGVISLIADATITRNIANSSDLSYNIGNSSNRYNETYTKTLKVGDGVAIWTSGNGSPEGVLAAPIGSLYTNRTGGAGTILYVKESLGGATTGWVAK